MYHRIVLVARPRNGSASFSWRAKCALENLGHTVFWFDSNRHPQLFEEGHLRISELAQFLGTQKPDALVLADETQLGDADEKLARSLAPSMLIGALGDVKSCATDLDFAWPYAQGIVDETWHQTPIANTVAYSPRLLCLQGATDERIAALRSLAPIAKEAGLVLRCTGTGWPKEWHVDKSEWNWFAYTERSAVFELRFNDGAGAPEPELAVLAATDGLKVVEIAPAPNTAADITAAEQAITELAKEGIPREARRLPAAPSAKGNETPTTLEALLQAALSELEKPESGRRMLQGSDSPRCIVTILGYFGMGNYGDELILATLDKLIRRTVAGSTVIAVSENPDHTLAQRGIYALSLKDLVAVDRALAHASTALVVAGLLFDQGIRWTAGKAEAFTSTRVSDIPGIAAYASLAAANDTPVIFHGIGAGPLEVLDGRQLVKLMGKLGALFVPRDAATADLIQSCGVPESQIETGADTIFLMADETPITPEQESLTVAVSLREYENTPSDFVKRMAQTFDAVAAARPEASFALCVLDPSDKTLAQAVIDNMTNAKAARIVDYGSDLDALTVFLQSAQAGFSMRYHSALIMASANVPCVGMSYLPKVASLYHDLGISALLVPPDATAEQCSITLLAAIDNAPSWKSLLTEQCTPLKRRSRHSFDKLVETIEGVRASKATCVPTEFLLHTRPAPTRREAALRKKLTAAEHNAAQAREQLKAAQRALEEERSHSKTTLEKMRSSLTWRLGSVLLALPRAIRRTLARKTRTDGRPTGEN